MTQTNTDREDTISFDITPERYRHLSVEVSGAVATIRLHVQEDGGLRSGYALKLNSYDLGVDIELADAVARLRFEQPQVGAVVLTSDQEGVFSAGANIFMLGASSHAFKVNFCKFTNETRLAMEEASAQSGQMYLAALNGIASGGGYELALACEKIFLVDDRRSAVALPEIPFLGVLPGTGGLTRVVDKRRVRRDRADIFCTLAEGVKGQRAQRWGLVDAVYPASQFVTAVAEQAAALAGAGHPERQGILLEPLQPSISNSRIAYRYVQLTLDEAARTADLLLHGPEELPALSPGGTLPCSWYPICAFRELDDALLRLRFNHREIGLVTVRTQGDLNKVMQLDGQLEAARNDWFVREVRLLIGRVLRRLELTSKSFFALIDAHSCFGGLLCELVLACDRAYMLEDEGVVVRLSSTNAGAYPASNGLSRLQTRWLGQDERVEAQLNSPQPLSATEAEAAGLVTVAVDALDWDDEIRVAIEERASLSPDALTGMEANLRFAGAETLATKIFGRLSAWQNWIFQRPNAVGDRGALKLYGQPESPAFHWERT